MAAPAVLRLVCRVVLWVVVGRHIDGRARLDVAVILLLERAAVVLEMVEDVECAMVPVFDQAWANLVGTKQRCEAVRIVDFGSTPAPRPATGSNSCSPARAASRDA